MCEKNRSFLEAIINFLQISRADLVRYPKDKVCYYFNMIDRYLKFSRSKNFANVQHREQLHPPGSHSVTSQQHQNRIKEVQFNPLRQGSTCTHLGSPQSFTQQSFPQSQENVINSLQNGSLVGSGIRNAMSTLPNGSPRSKQQYLSSHAQQTNMIASHNNGSQIGLEPRTISPLQHGSVKTIFQNTLNSQQPNSSPRTSVSALDHTMSTLPSSSAINSFHLINQQLKYQMLQMENMKQPMQQPLIEKNKRQMLMQKKFDLQRHKPNVQPADHFPQSLASSLPADHEKQSSGISPLSSTENTEPSKTPVERAEHSQATIQHQTLASGTQEISTSPLLIQFSSQESSQQSYEAGQPFKRLVESVCGIYFFSLFQIL